MESTKATTNNTPGEDDKHNLNNITRGESLRGWTIEAKLNTEAVHHSSQSRRSSFESSVLLDDEVDTGEDNENHRNHRDGVDYENDGYDDEDDDELSHYNLEVAVRAWDQIGALTQEITSSLMAKQASVLCERFRRKTWPLLKFEPATKKRRMDAGPSSLADEQKQDVSVVGVVSDEETASHGVASTEEEVRGLPDDLSSQVDRIGRMSKLVMEIEYCQQALRQEMIAMSNQF
jgi:hypothetical protein